MKTEPVAVMAAVETLMIALVTLVALLAGWSGDVTAAVMGVATAGVAVATSVIARNHVSPAE